MVVMAGKVGCKEKPQIGQSEGENRWGRVGVICEVVFRTAERENRWGGR